MLEAELARVSRVVGQQGKLSQRVVLGGETQSWSGSVESVNDLIEAFFVIAFLASAILLALGLWRRRK